MSREVLNGASIVYSSKSGAKFNVWEITFSHKMLGKAFCSFFFFFLSEQLKQELSWGISMMVRMKLLPGINHRGMLDGCYGNNYDESVHV